MTDFLMVMLLLVGTLALIGYIMVVVLQEYPKNALRWAQERRRRVERATVRRISALEHDLGYKPCSDSRCWSCAGYLERLDTTPITLYTRLWDEDVITTYADPSITTTIWK